MDRYGGFQDIQTKGGIMARARNIKPGFFKNEFLVEMSAFDRLLFIGLWLLADREGRIEDRPKRIKLELFPCDTYDVDAGLNTLAEYGFVKRYTNNVKSVVSIENFLKHQTPHGSEKDSELPDADGNMTVNDRDINGYVTGKKRINNVRLGINVKKSSSSGASEVDSRHLPVETTLNPESLNPESLNKRERPVGLVFPAWIPMEAWNGYSEMRKKIKKPMTDRAMRLKFLELQKFMDAGHDIATILDKSTENCWLDLYEPKTNQKTTPKTNWSAKPDWVVQAGFSDVADANSSMCWEHNANQFHAGKRAEVAA